jgi:hypothetical protein
MLPNPVAWHRKESVGVNLIVELHVVYYTNQVVELTDKRPLSTTPSVLNDLILLLANMF